MGEASGAADTPQRNREDIPDLLRAIPVKISANAGIFLPMRTMRTSPFIKEISARRRISLSTDANERPLIPVKTLGNNRYHVNLRNI